MKLRDLTADFVKTLEPYASPGDSTDATKIWLNANEYPTATKFEARFETLNRYPEVQPGEVIRRYAEYAGVKSSQVLVTRGADEAIELLIRTFCTPFKDRVIYPAPTYSMYSISARTCAVNVTELPSKENMLLDVEGLRSELKQSDKNTKIVFLCRPNNPTGEVVKKAAVEKLLKAAKNSLVVIDEAYIEFCPQESVADLLTVYPNLVIVRTLSKAFALAGLRCGMILADSEIIESVKKVMAPYPVPTPVAAIAERSLSEGGIAAMRQRVEVIKRNRDYLTGELKRLKGVRNVYPSETNFLLFEVDNASLIFQKLWTKGIALRKPGDADNTLRVSVGTIDECRAFIFKLTGLLKEAQL